MKATEAARQRRIVVALIVAIGATVLLAVGLSQLELARGRSLLELWAFLVGQLSVGVAGPMPPLPGGHLLIEVMRVIFFIALVLFPFSIIMILISRELRKRLLQTIIRIALLFFFLSAVMQACSLMAEADIEGLAGMLPQETEGPGDPLWDEDYVPEVSPWVVWSVSLIVGLLIAGIIVAVVWWLRRRYRRDDTLSQLLFEAESAINRLEQGGDLRDTIQRCYAEMSRVVRQSRGLRRDASVTPSEFITHLERAGLPSNAVRDLTHLFEAVRYGGAQYGPEDEQRALASLRTVVQACKEATA